MFIKVQMTVLLTLLLTTIGFNQTQILKESERIQIENAVNQTFDNLIKAAKEADVEKLFSYFAETDKGALVRDGVLLQTKHDAYESYKRGFEGILKIEYDMTQKYITIISTDVVLLVTAGNSVATTKSGQVFSTPMAQTLVFVLKNGAWKVLHAHNSVPGN